MTVTHNDAARRFEAEVAGGPALLAYSRRGDAVAFTHTEVPDEAAGQGVGTALVEAGLAWARAEGLPVVPLCAFVASYMAEHPETHDLVAAEARKWLDPDYDERR